MFCQDCIYDTESRTCFQQPNKRQYQKYLWNTRLKPIFHCILGLHWLPNNNEMSTNNMKSTWPTQEPIFHLFALGVCVRGNANFSVHVGGNANFRVFSPICWYPQRKTLLFGGIAQQDGATRVFSRLSGI